MNLKPLIPGDFATISSPAHLVGEELEAQFLPTSDDHLKFSIGHTNAYFVDEPTVFRQFLGQKTIPTVIPTSAALSYDHSFHHPGGSALYVYDQLRFTSSNDESTLTARVKESRVEPAFDRWR